MVRDSALPTLQLGDAPGKLHGDAPQLNTEGDGGPNVQQETTGDDDGARRQRLAIVRVDIEVPAAVRAAYGSPVAHGVRPTADDSDDDFHIGVGGDDDDVSHSHSPMLIWFSKPVEPMRRSVINQESDTTR